MTSVNGQTYFRPRNANTGEPTLTTYFTAAVCQLATPTNTTSRP